MSAPGGTAIYKGRPCQNGHPGMRYATTRNCVDCARQRRREERAGSRSAGRGINAEIFRMNYLAVYAPRVFDAEGWRHAATEPAE